MAGCLDGQSVGIRLRGHAHPAREMGGLAAVGLDSLTAACLLPVDRAGAPTTPGVGSSTTLAKVAYVQRCKNAAGASGSWLERAETKQSSGNGLACRMELRAAVGVLRGGGLAG